MNDPRTDEIIRRIEAALLHAGGTHTIDDVMAMVQVNAAQAWGSDNSGVVTEVLDYPRRRIGRVWLAGGDMQEIIDLCEGPISAWARANGCDSAEIIGREGWERVLRDRGWRKVASVLRKELRA